MIAFKIEPSVHPGYYKVYRKRWLFWESVELCNSIDTALNHVKHLASGTRYFNEHGEEVK